MDERELASKSPLGDTAVRIDLSEFAEALSSGVVRALERRGMTSPDREKLFDHWIWAGWIIGPGGPVGPLGNPGVGTPFGESAAKPRG